MLALSPTLFFTAYGWPMENLITQNLQQDCNHISNEFQANSNYSFLDSPTYDQIQQDCAPENSFSISSGGAINDNIGDCMKLAKKLNHNASERDRRKRVNDLYAFLRSLLPISRDQKKKVSIPRTVSRALKYIPELQKEIETLILKKQKLSPYSSSIANTSQVHLGIMKQRAKEAIIKRKSSVVSSVSALGEREAMIQLISSNDHMSKNKEIGFLSKVLEFLEYEEGGLVLLNSTTLKCSGEGMLLNTLHLQAQGDKKIEVERLKEKLCSFYQQSDQISL